MNTNSVSPNIHTSSSTYPRIKKSEEVWAWFLSTSQPGVWSVLFCCFLVAFVIMVLCEEHRCAMEWGLCSQLSLHQTLAHALPMAKIALNQWPNLPKFHLGHLPTDDNNSVYPSVWGFSVALVVKNPFAKAGDRTDRGSIFGLGRSPGGWYGSPLQYSCLESPMGREAWWSTVLGMRRIGHK